MIELRGDIVQIPHTKDRRSVLYLKTEFELVHGRYGFSCWWLPLGEKIGIKIHNHAPTPNLQGAKNRLDFLRRRWEGFARRLFDAKKYLPEVLGWTVIAHTGKYEKGGRVRRSGNDVKAFYPATFIRNYPVAKLDSIGMVGLYARSSRTGISGLLRSNTCPWITLGSLAGSNSTFLISRANSEMSVAS